MSFVKWTQPGYWSEWYFNLNCRIGTLILANFVMNYFGTLTESSPASVSAAPPNLEMALHWFNNISWACNCLDSCYHNLNSLRYGHCEIRMEEPLKTQPVHRTAVWRPARLLALQIRVSTSRSVQSARRKGRSFWQLNMGPIRCLSSGRDWRLKCGCMTSFKNYFLQRRSQNQIM